MSIYLTQSEADFLFDLKKIPEKLEETYHLPVSGKKIFIPFTSLDKRESFLFDINRASIKLTKITFQNRARKSIVLRRLDIDGSPHTNPLVQEMPNLIPAKYNGSEIPSPHMHIYIDGFHHKWAIPAEDVINLTDKDNFDILIEFFKYCNVAKNPVILDNLGL